MKSLRLGPLLYLQVGSIRYASLYILGFFGGIAAVAGSQLRLSVGWAALWIAYWVIFCVAVELLNRVFDIRADRINQPTRTRLALRYGGRTLIAIAWAAWVVLAVGSIALAAVSGTPWLMVTALASNLLIGVGYSYKGVAKRHPAVATWLLSATMFMPFLTGCAWAGISDATWATSLRAIGPATLLNTISVAIAGAKDITDTQGDLAIGYRSIWLSALQTGISRKAAVICAIQLVIIVAISATGKPAFALAAALIPLEVSVAVVVRRFMSQGVTDPLAFRAIREYMYLVTVVSVGVVCLTLSPSWSYLAVVVACMIAWTAFSRWLHWHSDFRLPVFKRAIQLLIGRQEFSLVEEQV